MVYAQNGLSVKRGHFPFGACSVKRFSPMPQRSDQETSERIGLTS
jgi:hypothetical protein